MEISSYNQLVIDVDTLMRSNELDLVNLIDPCNGSNKIMGVTLCWAEGWPGNSWNYEKVKNITKICNLELVQHTAITLEDVKVEAAHYTINKLKKVLKRDHSKAPLSPKQEVSLCKSVCDKQNCEMNIELRSRGHYFIVTCGKRQPEMHPQIHLKAFGGTCDGREIPFDIYQKKFLMPTITFDEFKKLAKKLLIKDNPITESLYYTMLNLLDKRSSRKEVANDAFGFWNDTASFAGVFLLYKE